ncbi:proteobacterial dedicated sortase system response regulator [Thalassotalea sp. HSM 43]|uniref:proteobacterial dedicated sortase system response regulator n=1 Tax=Thalassotalea sp. HSM 43 TaxID=2552945 RepID=UPI00108223D2|nr:proteobacterial dedicated sortase system response regulator [Thalassotalea sp. HSM 43]QBY03642.1 proteobacterial dedicated sortase system response regulator [Thalassotalea sp. HSM 43]
MSKRIAIVEDDEAIRENYAQALRQQGFVVQTYRNKSTALSAFELSLPHLAILDVGLEEEFDGGFDICRYLREKSATLPIIFLTARDSDIDQISGLRLGANDYVSKTMSFDNLSARIHATLNYLKIIETPVVENILQRQALTINKDRLSISWHNDLVNFTITEFWMIHSLALNPGHVKSKDQLMQDANIVVDDNTVTAHIKRIRKKFMQVDTNFNCIDTVYGMGYRWLEAK